MNPQLTRFLFAISSLCKVLGLVMASHGMTQTGVYFWVELIGGSVMVVGPAIYDVWTSGAAVFRAQAIGVQAGINLVASGKAVTSSGKPITMLSPAPAKPVTLQSANQIVADYGPDHTEIPKV